MSEATKEVTEEAEEPKTEKKFKSLAEIAEQNRKNKERIKQEQAKNNTAVLKSYRIK